MVIKSAFNRLKFNLKQATPDILVAAGVAASVAAAVGFCRQSRKAIPFIDKYRENIEKIRCAHEDAKDPDSAVSYDDKTYRKDVIEETVKTAGKLGSIYIVPIALEVVSIGCFIGSHGMMKENNAAIAAAYAGIAGELKGLHDRIIERYGEAVDAELTHGIEIVEEKSIDPATGSEITEYKAVSKRDWNDPNYYSPYARYYDETVSRWTDMPEHNHTWLVELEHLANVRLQRQGYLFLNDVYDMIGFERSEAGQVVGWTYSRSGNNPYGDNRVSFGLDRVDRPGVRDFINERTPYVLLDFNVDGKILNVLPR